jgi:hypothetical protein
MSMTWRAIIEYKQNNYLYIEEQKKEKQSEYNEQTRASNFYFKCLKSNMNITNIRFTMRGLSLCAYYYFFLSPSIFIS